MIKPNFQSRSQEQYDWLVKVIILGDSGVGKTNILTQFCDGKFSPNYMATIGVDFKIKTITIENRKIKLQIWDTAGQERFRNITQTYYKGAYGIIYAYSIADKKSFKNVDSWIKSIKDNTSEEVQYIRMNLFNLNSCQILVGNKIDLEHDRQVSQEEGNILADSYEIPFLEVSAKEARNIGADLKVKLEREDQKQKMQNEKNTNVELKANQPQNVDNQCKC